MAQFSGTKVLVVDDTPSVRMVLRALLETHGCICEEAHDGDSALRCLEASSFDLIITDYRMPIMNGIEFLDRLSQRADLPHPPVVLHSSGLDKTLQERALKAGVRGFLVKPPERADVLSTVAQIFNLP